MNAQCTPDPSCIDTGNPGQMCPDTLSDGYINTVYSQVVTILPPGSFDFGGNTIVLSHIKIISIDNIPPGLSYETNATGNLFAVGSSYCAVISGTPTTVGEYQLMVNIKPYTSATEPLPFVVTDDTSLAITIYLENGLYDIEDNRFNYDLYPNPFNNQLILDVDSDSGSKGSLFLFDAIGREVRREELEIISGDNQFIIETGKLEDGIYFYQLFDGQHLYTNKLLKQ